MAPTYKIMINRPKRSIPIKIKKEDTRVKEENKNNKVVKKENTENINKK